MHSEEGADMHSEEGTEGALKGVRVLHAFRRRNRGGTKRNVWSKCVQDTWRTTNQHVFLSAARQLMMLYQSVVTWDVSVKGQGSLSTTGIFISVTLRMFFSPSYPGRTCGFHGFLTRGS